MKKFLLSGVLAIAVAAMVGISTNVSAQPVAQTFSVAVHIAYPSGFEYDGVFATGVPSSDLPTYLVACNQSHKWGVGSEIHFHCYPIPE